MFEKSIYNITGTVPFPLNKFPILIEVGDGLGAKKVLCKTSDDIPQGTDFIVLGTCIATIQEHPIPEVTPEVQPERQQNRTTTEASQA